MTTEIDKSFSPGDMVFAKIRGYPHWPAIVNSIDSNGKTTKYNIKYFGTSESGLVKDTNICSYLENFETYGQKKTDNFKNKAFNQAMDEAKTNMALIIQNRDGQQVFEHNEALLMNNSRHELERSLLENTPQTKEDILILAAKVGSALLEENEVLKSKNCMLLAKIMSLQSKIEDLERGEEQYLTKIELLHQRISDTEGQRSKEKNYYFDIKHIFEEHNEKQAQKIKEQEMKIEKQEKELFTLHHKLCNETKVVHQEIITKKYKTSETQTDFTSNTSATNSTSLITEIGLLKKAIAT
ncbi:PC4 and SFRS1-interacting protein [Homalodisca vitripennis]|nr:PC4 and SFRS1-interacting protein [Homalodisca vitripennis]